jgi:hypothetical protein
MDEQPDVIGFLGSNGTLYCSRACALRQGTEGDEVDQDEYDSLLEGESLRPGSLCRIPRLLARPSAGLTDPRRLGLRPSRFAT